MIDYNVRPSAWAGCPAPQLQTNPIQVVKDAAAAGHGSEGLRGQLAQERRAAHELRGSRRAAQLAAQHVRVALQPAGLQGKGHEYFLKHLLGTSNGVQGKGPRPDDAKPTEVVWHDKAPEGKLTCW